MSATPATPATPTRRWLRRVAWGVLALGLVVALALAGAVAWYAPQLPPLDRVTAYQPRQPLQVFTADGVEIAQFGAERRRYTPIAQIPPLLQQAVLAVEDARFREHPGIDLKGVARALVAAATGGMRQGASTITQQVARTFFLSSRLTAERKIKEALLALRIEQQLGKDQILALYMNQIYLGQRAYGFAAAAEAYFGKPLAALSIAEAAMLAGLPQNPSYANPVANLERATQRQHIVLARMQATGVINEAQHAAARAETLHIRNALQVPLHAEHVAEMARRLVVERFGTEVYSQGIRVHTSLRAADQQAAWAALRRGVLAYDARQPWRGPEDHADLPPDGSPELERAAAQALKDVADDEQLRAAIVIAASPRELQLQLAGGEALRISGEGLRLVQAALGPRAAAALAIHRGDILRVWQPPARAGGTAAAWAVTQWPEVQAAFVALDAATGRVRALVGGFDFARQPFDHVTQAWRQPGSSFKPFLYSAALDHGLMPATLVNDAPLESADGWAPQNSDGQFDGPLTLRQALARSKNLVSVRVLQRIGVPAALAGAGRYGFDTTRQPDNLTLALGAGSTTPLQLAQAYAVLASGGWRVAPVVVERITDAQGKLLFQAPPPAPLDEARRAVPARNVFVTNSLLNDVTRIGTAARAQQQLQRTDLYGKTGTTNDAVDAWFAGFQGGGGADGLVAVAWMGFDQPQSLGQRESGGGLALPIWIDYMAQALKGVPVAPPPLPPEGLEQVDGDWRYAEWADGGAVLSIGLDDAAAAPAAADAASAAAGLAAASAPPLPPHASASHTP
jgi:penicillin-binding protein 1A